jgi:hypothetical protein
MQQGFYFEKTSGSLKAKMLPLFTRPPWLEKAKKTSCFFHAFLPSAHLVF